MREVTLKVQFQVPQGTELEKLEKIRSGNEEVFNSGIPRLPVLLNFPITYLHTF